MEPRKSLRFSSIRAKVSGGAADTSYMSTTQTDSRSVGYSHNVVVFHTLRKGICSGITVKAEVRVCSRESALETEAALRRNLDVVESHIERL